MPEGNQRQVAQGKAEVLYPALIRISRSASESMQTRWRALTLASSLKSQEVLPELEQALKAPEWFMRNAALVSLEQYHPKRAQQAAQVLLKDKALVVRSAAVQVLGKKMDDQTRDLFWEQLASAQNFRHKQSLWIRGQMLSLLAENPQARETGLFAKALQDNDVKVHAPAIAALEKLTQKVLGSPKTALSEKRALWVQWAKSRPSGTL
jgi:HEAT repeat protein